MKKIILLAIASLTINQAIAGPNAACISRVQNAVKEAVALFPAVDTKTISVAVLRSKPIPLSAMEGEAQTPGYKVYTAVSFRDKKAKTETKWMNESGVVFDGDATCSVLYSNVDIAG